jgi:tripartite-type tricarboxylate transporter receptor subunit TctC
MHAAAVAYLTGMKAEHVPYRGTPEAVNDAMSGRVLYVFAPGPNAVPLAKAGKLQILATTSAAGSDFMPGVPSLEQAGVPYEGDDWFGVFAPAGTPLAIRERFAGDMAKVLEIPDVKTRLAALGAMPAFMGAQEWEKFAREYVARMKKLGQDIGIKPQ